MGPDDIYQTPSDPLYQKLLKMYSGNEYKAAHDWWNLKRAEVQAEALGRTVTYDDAKRLLSMPTGAEIDRLFDGYEWKDTWTNNTSAVTVDPSPINPDGNKEFTITWQMTATVTVDQLWPDANAPKDPVPADVAALFKDKQWYVNDLPEYADVSVNHVAVTGEGDDLDDGAQVTVEIEDFGHYW